MIEKPRKKMSSASESSQSPDFPSGDCHKHKAVDSLKEEPLHDLLNPEKMGTEGRKVFSLSANTRPRLNHHFELDECPDTLDGLAPRRKHKYGGNRHRKSLVLQDQSNKLCYYPDISIRKPDPVLCVKRSRKNRKKNKKYRPIGTSKSSPISDDDFMEDQNENPNTKEAPDTGKEHWQIEARRESIQQKLVAGLEALLTKAEEEDIHERAEFYSVTVCPDIEYYVLPEDDPEPHMEDNELFLAQQHKRRKRRNYLNCKCYVKEHSNDVLYDNTKMLSIGTKLLRPTSKLVELVAQAIEGSPDGLLQVQQIYTVLQNKFPYFRYMDKSAISSWRSSIRHALYQKWFVKIRFRTDTINCKGCYWKISEHYHLMEKTEVKAKPQKKTKDGTKSPNGCGNNITETYDAVESLLSQDHENDQSNLQDVIKIAKEYGISIADCVDEADYKMGQIAMTAQSRDSDPILSNCISDQKYYSDEELLTYSPSINKSPSESSDSHLSDNSVSLFMSPLINDATKKELIGIDPKTQMDKSPFGNWIHDWEDNYYSNSPFSLCGIPAIVNEESILEDCKKADNCFHSVPTLVDSSNSEFDCRNDTILSVCLDVEQPYAEHW